MPAVGASFEIVWDPLSALMTLVVTGVGSLIHIYSLGYMHGDPRFSRFFAYLNLFTASMLTLVLAGNYAMLFVGWELVGLCSYLLISFWFTRPSAAAAGKKAFVVNRIGDFGFLIALMLIFSSFGTLSYSGVFDRAAQELTGSAATLIGLMLAAGAIGKSAQIPLYVWLPDAMEGPTPVSALIHAATLVTAGVYVIARSAPIFELAPAGLGSSCRGRRPHRPVGGDHRHRAVRHQAGVGLFHHQPVGLHVPGSGGDCLCGRCVPFDDPRLLQGSPVPGAGSVIHAMGGRQNMEEMGGLRKAMPVTFVTMGIGVVAIAGLPPLAGFWSKDEILGVVFNQGGFFTVLWLVGLITALLTAFYMIRQFVMVFLGRPRWPEGVVPHESPRSMTVPLAILAVLSVLGGLVNTPFRLGLEHFLEPSFEGVKLGHPAEGVVSILVLAAVAVGAERWAPPWPSSHITGPRRRGGVSRLHSARCGDGGKTAIGWMTFMGRCWSPPAAASLSRPPSGWIWGWWTEP